MLFNGPSCGTDNGLKITATRLSEGATGLSTSKTLPPGTADAAGGP